MRRRRLLGWGLGLGGLAGTPDPVLGQGAAKAAGPSWAVLSLVGDALTVVRHVPAEGSRLDTNQREAWPLKSPVFDHDALTAAADAVAAAVPGAQVAMLMPSAPSQYDNQTELLAGDVARLAPEVVDPVRATGASHLVLVSKHRGQSMLRVSDGSVGSGWLEGLGFYVDRSVRMARSDTNEKARGFLAPFAYVSVAIVDTRSLAVVARRSVTASSTFSAARSKDPLDPWDALSAEQKMDVLRGMLRHEVAAAVSAAIQAMGERR